jgi:hypothetical protein
MCKMQQASFWRDVTGNKEIEEVASGLSSLLDAVVLRLGEGLKYSNLNSFFRFSLHCVCRVADHSW